MRSRRQPPRDAVMAPVPHAPSAPGSLPAQVAGTAGHDGAGAQTAAPGQTLAQPGATPAAGQPAPHELVIEDHLEPRVRIPADLIRCVIALVEIGLLVGLALAASATATGVELDLVGASRKFPADLLNLFRIAAGVAFLILPVALAIRLALLRQFRRLTEAVGTGAVSVVVVAAVNALLNLPGLAELHAALHTTNAAFKHQGTLDGYLAGLVAYVTVIGLRGRPQWRTAFMTAIGFYALANLADSRATVLSLLITMLIGSAIGYSQRYVFGAMSGRPTAAEIVAALGQLTKPVTEIRRVGNGGSEVRRYAARLADGEKLDIAVFDRDQQAADAFYRLYRRIRLRSNVTRHAPLAMEAAIERQALLIYATEDAGVRTPRLQAVSRVGPDAAVVATEHVDGTTLDAPHFEPTDSQLAEVWDTVLTLHRHRVTHRALTADRIMFAANGIDSSAAGLNGTGTQMTAAAGQADGAAVGAPDHRAADGPQPNGGPQGHASGQVILLDPGNGDVAASDLQIRLDLAQLLAETALLVGADRAATLAIEKVDGAELPALIPLLQPVVLYRSTRSAVRSNKGVLAGVRKRLAAAAPDAEYQPVQLERIRTRTVLTLIASVFALYLVAPQLADFKLKDVFQNANVVWAFLALAFSAVTYVGATLSLTGFVLERLRPVYTGMVQVAASFVTLVTPPAVGGLALNARYLRKARLSAADAAASLGLMQAVSFCVYIVLLVIFAMLAGRSPTHGLHAPSKWVYLVLAVIGVVVLALMAIPAGRRQLFSRVVTVANQIVPRLLDVAQRPMKLCQGIGGALLVSLGYIFCLTASVRAFGVTSVPFATLAVVALTGTGVASIVPIPGGLGAIEAALTAGLVTAGVPGGTAFAAVLLYRTFTFWLPVPTGWVAMHFLQRREVL